MKSAMTICIMNQQVHNWSKIYYTGLYYPALLLHVSTLLCHIQGVRSQYLLRYMDIWTQHWWYITLHYITCITNTVFIYPCNLAGTDYELPEDDPIASKHVGAEQGNNEQSIKLLIHCVFVDSYNNNIMKQYRWTVKMLK